MADPAMPDQEAAALSRPHPLATAQQLTVKFWGTRGSIPVSGPQYVGYGGNTSCVSVQSDVGHLFIFDAGSGIRPLGIALREAAAADHSGPAGYLLLSHSHWDHIQGFPFFQPAFSQTAQFSIIGCCDAVESYAELLARQMEHCYFPVPLASLPAELRFHTLCDGHHRLDGADLAVLVQKHTLPSTAFRLTLGGKSVVYASDNEPLSGPGPASDTLIGFDVIDRNLVEFARDADLLIHDAQYTLEEYPARVGWGHSVPEIAVDTAIHAGARRVALFHHDPEHNDVQLDAMLARAQERARHLGSGLEVIGARDGLTLNL